LDDGLKQRLIGAVVLIAIAILFVPSLFNQGGRKAVDLATQVPPEPEEITQSIEIPLPQPPESARPGKPLSENYDHSATEPTADVAEAEDESGAQEAIAVAEALPRTPSPEPPQPDVQPVQPNRDTLPVLNNDGVPRAWSIQIGSYSEKSRADAMLQRLSKEGFDRGYIRSAQGANGELYRVFVGPKINRNDAESDQARLDKTFKIKSLLVEFKP